MKHMNGPTISRRSFVGLGAGALLLPSLGRTGPALAASQELTIGVLRAPTSGIMAISDQKGWFKEAGVDVDFSWFEYVPSMDAFSTRKVDAVCVTNGDALVTGSTGAPSAAILINDYSNGNDMVVARAGIAPGMKVRMWPAVLVMRRFLPLDCPRNTSCRSFTSNGVRR